MLLSAGEQISIALLSMAIIDLGRDAISLTGAQAGIHTDTSHGSARIVDVRSDRVARRSTRASSSSSPASRASRRRGHDDARPRRLGHDRGRARGGARRRGLRDLHRRRGRLQRRPAHRPRGRQARPPLVRGDAGARRLGREGARGSLGRVRAAKRRAAPRTVDVRRHRRNLDSARRTGMEQAIISGIAHDTSEAKVTIRDVPDQPGIAARDLPPARRRGRERGHDRPERLGRRTNRRLLHGAEVATCAAAEPVLRADRARRRRARRHDRHGRSRRSRWSARA